MSLEMAHKVIVPQKKNYVPQFLKQRDINSYCVSSKRVKHRAMLHQDFSTTYSDVFFVLNSNLCVLLKIFFLNR
jgi:hypothetical protein